MHFHSSVGCQRCQFTGYRGRIGVFELLELDDNMVSALRLDDSDGFAKAAKNSPHFKPLALAALEYAKQGITSLEEVFKLVDRFDRVKSTHADMNIKLAKADALANLTPAPADERESALPASAFGFAE